MCINPRQHPSGLQTPCHQCWQCKENRVNDWVGRCIAERETALGASTVTLTYGGGDCPESRFLRKSDIATYIKALRNKGHKVRYFAVGEYGTLKGRAHWHVVLFWQTPAPHRPQGENIACEFWPHGFSYWLGCEPYQIRYAMKYINKDFDDQRALRSMAMSKKPILGAQYFEELAGRYVDAGMSPQRPFYKFREVLNKEGKPLEFYMPPLVAAKFCSAFIRQWTAKRGGHWPTSDFVDKYHDKMATLDADLILRPYRRGEVPWMLPPAGFRQMFDEPKNSFYASDGATRLWWSYDEEGQRAWRSDLVMTADAEKRQETSRSAKSAESETRAS